MATKPEAVEPDYSLIRLPTTREVMGGPEYLACLAACRLSNRQVATMLGHTGDYTVRNWTGQTKWYCPPPAPVQAWLRKLALGHMAVDRANPPPVMTKGEDRG